MIPLHPKVINDPQSNLLQQDGMTLTSDIFKSNPMVYGGGHNTQCQEKPDPLQNRGIDESCDSPDQCTSGNCEGGKCAADRGEPPGTDGQSPDSVDMPCNGLTIATAATENDLTTLTGKLFDIEGTTLKLKSDYLTCEGDGTPRGIKPNILYGISTLDLNDYITFLKTAYTLENVSETRRIPDGIEFFDFTKITIPRRNGLPGDLTLAYNSLEAHGINNKLELESESDQTNFNYSIKKESHILYQILAIKAFQDDKKKSFKGKVSNLWRDQAALPNDWSSYFTSIYGTNESGRNPIIKELRERDVSTKQLEFDKMLNNEITKFHSLTQQAIQTKQARDFAGTVVETATKQREKLEADIGRYTSDIMSKDRQIQINQNTYFKILDETKKLKIFYIFTILSIVIVCLGLLNFGISFTFATIAVVIFVVLAFYLASRHQREGTRNPNNIQELQFKTLSDDEMDKATADTEVVKKEGLGLCSNTGEDDNIGCVFMEKDKPGLSEKDNADHRCIKNADALKEAAKFSDDKPITAAKNNNTIGMCYHKDDQKAQPSTREQELERELLALKQHHSEEHGAPGDGGLK